MTEANRNSLKHLRRLASSQFGHFWNIGDRSGQPTLASMPPSPSLPHLARPANAILLTLSSYLPHSVIHTYVVLNMPQMFVEE